MSLELEESLRWWQTMLTLGIVEFREWDAPAGKPVHVFCDAAGSPARLGAVLFLDDNCQYTSMIPPDEAVALFKRRGDQQIMALELLAIAMALSTFQKALRGRRVVIHCDNTGSE
eukprot:2825026-Karenia_brevis.AAC.1